MMKVPLLIWFGGVCSLGSLSAQSREEEAFDIEFAEQQQLHEDAVIKATFDLRKIYREQLLALEKRAAKHGDYDGAVTVRDKRIPVETFLDEHDLDRRKALEENMIILKIEDAECSGAIDVRSDYLGGWRTNKSRATWNIRGVKRGRYEVLMRYSSSVEEKTRQDANGNSIKEMAGGSIEFGEHTNLLGADPPLKYRLISTKDWNDYREVSLGQLTLNNVAPSLRMRVTEVLPLGLMRLKSIRLVPVSSDGLAGSSLDVLEARHEELMRNQRSLLDQSYDKELRALDVKASGDGDTALAKEIRAELNQIKP